MKYLNLNLATRPLRNRRLFFFLCIGLSLLILLAAVHAGVTLWKYGGKNSEVLPILSGLNEQVKTVKRRELQLKSMINKQAEASGNRVDRINSIIFQKSFSWTAFLSEMEELLPESCYVRSMAPVPKGGQKMAVTLSLAAPALNELLVFIKRLRERNIQSIRIQGESRTDRGNLLVRMSFIYEGTH